MVTEFASFILYTQLLVATPAAAAIGLLWTDDAVAQGFAWDAQTVSFGVPDHDGNCLIRVDTAPDPGAPLVFDDALWAISVPFTATQSTVLVGTIFDDRPIAIDPGVYRLVFQVRPGRPPYAYSLEIRFIRAAAPDFAILKRGELGSERVLERQAHHAS